MNTNTASQFPDLDFDDLPELPSFAVPPMGTYTLKLVITSKVVAKKPAIEFEYEVMELLEQVDPTEVPATIGNKFSVAYFLDNEFGQGKLKKSLMPLKEFFGTGNVAAIAEGCAGGLVVTGTVKSRLDSKGNLDNDGNPKKYADVVNLLVN